MTALRKREAYRGEGSLEGWVWRIVMTTAASAERKRERQREGSDSLPGEWSPNGRPDLERLAAEAPLRALVAQLPLRQRQALFLHYDTDLEYASAAEALAGAQLGTAPAPQARRITVLFDGVLARMKLKSLHICV